MPGLNTDETLSHTTCKPTRPKFWTSETKSKNYIEEKFDLRKLESRREKER
jgi:hypothetical protein